METETTSDIITPNTIIVPRWVSLIFKTCGILFLINSALILVDLVIPLIISEWPIVYPSIDLALYTTTGFLIISIVLGLGFLGMKKWLVPILTLSLICATLLVVRGFGFDFFIMGLILLILFILVWPKRRYFTGLYLSKKNYLIYAVFITAIILVFISVQRPVCGNC